MNKVILIGRLTADPNLRYTQNGTPVTTFTLAVDKPFAIDGDEGMFPGDFSEARNVINCRCSVEYNVVAINKPTHDELGDMSFDDWMSDRLH